MDKTLTFKLFISGVLFVTSSWSHEFMALNLPPSPPFSLHPPDDLKMDLTEVHPMFLLGASRNEFTHRHTNDPGPARPLFHPKPLANRPLPRPSNVPPLSYGFVPKKQLQREKPTGSSVQLQLEKPRGSGVQLPRHGLHQSSRVHEHKKENIQVQATDVYRDRESSHSQSSRNTQLANGGGPRKPERPNAHRERDRQETIRQLATFAEAVRAFRDRQHTEAGRPPHQPSNQRRFHGLHQQQNQRIGAQRLNVLQQQNHRPSGEQLMNMQQHARGMRADNRPQLPNRGIQINTAAGELPRLDSFNQIHGVSPRRGKDLRKQREDGVETKKTFLLFKAPATEGPSSNIHYGPSYVLNGLTETTIQLPEAFPTVRPSGAGVEAPIVLDLVQIPDPSLFDQKEQQVRGPVTSWNREADALRYNVETDGRQVRGSGADQHGFQSMHGPVEHKERDGVSSAGQREKEAYDVRPMHRPNHARTAGPGYRQRDSFQSNVESTYQPVEHRQRQVNRQVEQTYHPVEHRQRQKTEHTEPTYRPVEYQQRQVTGHAEPTHRPVEHHQRQVTEHAEPTYRPVEHHQRQVSEHAQPTYRPVDYQRQVSEHHQRQVSEHAEPTYRPVDYQRQVSEHHQRHVSEHAEPTYRQVEHRQRQVTGHVRHQDSRVTESGSFRYDGETVPNPVDPHEKRAPEPDRGNQDFGNQGANRHSIVRHRPPHYDEYQEGAPPTSQHHQSTVSDFAEYAHSVENQDGFTSTTHHAEGTDFDDRGFRHPAYADDRQTVADDLASNSITPPTHIREPEGYPPTESYSTTPLRSIADEFYFTGPSQQPAIPKPKLKELRKHLNSSSHLPISYSSSVSVVSVRQGLEVKPVRAPAKPAKKPKQSVKKALSSKTAKKTKVDDYIEEDPYGDMSVPGEAGVDYPNYRDIPETRFSCRTHAQPGFYADQDTGCQVFHNCDTSMSKHSFLCPNGTIFHQELFICDWWYNVQCEDTRAVQGLQSGQYAGGSEDDDGKRL